MHRLRSWTCAGPLGTWWDRPRNTPGISGRQSEDGSGTTRPGVVSHVAEYVNGSRKTAKKEARRLMAAALSSHVFVELDRDHNIWLLERGSGPTGGELGRQCRVPFPHGFPVWRFGGGEAEEQRLAGDLEAAGAERAGCRVRGEGRSE